MRGAVLCRGVGSGVKSVKMTKHFYGFRGARQKPPPPRPKLPGTHPANHNHQRNIFTLPRQNHPPNPGKTFKIQPSPPNREAIPSPEGANVTPTTTTRKNTWQQHPPQTKPPSQNSSALLIHNKSNRSTLQILNPGSHAQPFRPPDTAIKPKYRQIYINREGDKVPGGRFCSRRVILANPSSSPVNDDGKKPETTALARNYSLVKANQS